MTEKMLPTFIEAWAGAVREQESGSTYRVVVINRPGLDIFANYSPVEGTPLSIL